MSDKEAVLAGGSGPRLDDSASLTPASPHPRLTTAVVLLLVAAFIGTALAGCSGDSATSAAATAGGYGSSKSGEAGADAAASPDSRLLGEPLPGHGGQVNSLVFFP